MLRVFAIVLLALVGTGPVAAAGDSSVARTSRTSIVASADVRTRTSIVASTELLRFQVADDNQPAIATLSFSAGARAAATSEVLLIVIADEPLASPSALCEMAMTVSSGASRQPVTAGERVVAAQWIGGGLRSGELQFQLRAAAGVYSVPVKLQVIVP